MKIELKLELDTEQEKDEMLLRQLIELFEDHNVNVFDQEDIDKT